VLSKYHQVTQISEGKLVNQFLVLYRDREKAIIINYYYYYEKKQKAEAQKPTTSYEFEERRE